MSHALDRPVWNALTTVHAALAFGGDLARRYSPAIHPFAATRDENPESLRSLAGIAAAGETLMFLQADEFVLPPGFSTVLADFGVQMVAEQPFPATADDRIVRLGDADAAAMLELATLTRPGPFTLRALALGEVWGVKENGRPPSTTRIQSRPSTRARSLAAAAVGASTHVRSSGVVNISPESNDRLPPSVTTICAG